MSDEKCPLCGMEMVKRWPDAVEPDRHIEGSGQCWVRQVTQLRAEIASLKKYIRDLQPADRPVCHECEMPLMPDGECRCSQEENPNE